MGEERFAKFILLVISSRLLLTTRKATILNMVKTGTIHTYVLFSEEEKNMCGVYPDRVSMVLFYQKLPQYIAHEIAPPWKKHRYIYHICCFLHLWMIKMILINMIILINMMRMIITLITPIRCANCERLIQAA